MARFEGKVALITGGALGIGGATARRLAAEGASVLIADIDDDAAAANVERIADGGGTAVASHIDVSSSDDCRRMVDDTIDAFGRVDILVQNAFSVISGESRIHGDALSVEEEDWDYGIDVLVKALYLGAKHAVPHMRAAGGGSMSTPRRASRRQVAGPGVEGAGTACEQPPRARMTRNLPCHIVARDG